MKTRSRREDTTRISDTLASVHEAAHVVAAYRLSRPDHPRPVSKPAIYVSIDPNEKGNACAVFPSRNPSKVRAQLIAEPETRDDLRSRVEDHVVGLLAGFAAEHRWGKKSKEEAWTFVEVYAYAIANKKRLMKEGIFEEHTDVTEAWEYLSVFEPYPIFRREWLRELFGRTWKSVGEWMPDIKRVAVVLQEKRTIDRDGIEEIHEMLGEAGIPQGETEEATA